MAKTIKEFKEQLDNVIGMDKEEFMVFFNKYYDCQGCGEGLYVTSDLVDADFVVYFTNLDVYKKLKETDEYKEIADNYTEEQIEEYENKLEQAESDLMYNNSYYLNLYDEYLEINEIVCDYYAKNDEEFDSETLYNARDYIKEETEEKLEELEY